MDLQHHFVRGKKNDDLASLAYIPTFFKHTRSPDKRKAVSQLARYERTSVCKKRRLEAQLEAEREDQAATALLQLSSPESHQNHTHPSGVCQIII